METKYNSLKNNAEHEVLSNEFGLLATSLSEINLIMVSKKINGDLRRSFDKFDSSFKNFNKKLNDHKMNSLELGSNEHKALISELENSVERLKQADIVHKRDIAGHEKREKEANKKNKVIVSMVVAIILIVLEKFIVL